MKKFLMCLAVVLFASVVFTSCEKKNDAELLCGKWSLTSAFVTEDGWTAEINLASNEYFYYRFISGGKYIEETNVYNGLDSYDPGTWVLDGKELTLTKGQGTQIDQWFYTIKEITNSTLTLEEHNSDGSIIRKTMNFTKVNRR